MAIERKRIIINFKNTPEDLELYKELKKHSSISGYVKDILKGVIPLATTIVNNSDSKKENSEKIDIDDVLGGI